MATPRVILDEIERKKRDIQSRKIVLEEQIIVSQEEFKNIIETLNK